MRLKIATLLLALSAIGSIEARAGELHSGHYAQHAVVVPLVVHHAGYEPRVQLLVTPLAGPVVVLFAEPPKQRVFAVRRLRSAASASRCR